MKTTLYSILAAAACGMAFGQTAYTTPVGYVSQTCLKSSDTVIGLPLQTAVRGAGALSVNPDLVTTPGSAILTLAGTPGFTVDAFKNVSYVRFTSGPANGRFYAVTGNTASAITVNLNGDVLDAVATNTLAVTDFWTLNALFNPAVTTNSSATTGNAVVNSLSASNGNRRTQLFFANISTSNINLAPSATYYVLADITNPPTRWVRVGDATFTDQGAIQCWPDVSMTLRNPASLAGDTTYTCTGEVVTGATVTPLLTRVGAAAAQRDNPRVLSRPVNVSLTNLQLGGTSAFVTSATVSNGNRRDTLFVYNNDAAVINKAPSASYYYLAAQVDPVSPAKWVRVGDATLADSGNVVIPAGAGFFIRKYGTAAGTTSFWTNTPTY